MRSKVNSNIEVHEQYANVSINPELFSLEAIIKAAYSLIEDAYFSIDGDINTRICVELKPVGKKKPEAVARNFCNELIKAQVFLMNSEKHSKITEALIKEVLEGNEILLEEEKLKENEEH